MFVYILTYNSNLTRKDITTLNYSLFGKVLVKNTKKYFYPGTLDNINCYKLSNGCYMIKEDINDASKEITFDDRVQRIPAEIHDGYNSLFKTVREIKREKYEGDYVKNL